MAIKNFVLDTNVILHDAGCIMNFADNNIIIPMAVLEEVEKVMSKKTSKLVIL